jgi:hypothetical protein
MIVIPTEDTVMDSVTTSQEAVEPTTSPLPLERLPGATGEALTRQIDALSLAQALVDFEMANARVLDLTARLVEANERVARSGRREIEATEATRAAEARATAAADAQRALDEVTIAHSATREELARVRAEVATLHGELDAHRAVIEARDRDATEFHREIAARDEVVRVRTDELSKLRGSLTFRVASKLTSVVRRRR